MTFAYFSTCDFKILQTHQTPRRLPLPSQLHRSFVTLVLVLVALLMSVLEEVSVTERELEGTAGSNAAFECL